MHKKRDAAQSEIQGGGGVYEEVSRFCGQGNTDR